MVYNKPANTMVAGFIGVPAMNLIRLRRRSEAVYNIPAGPDLELGPLAAPLAEIILGIRPEHLRVLTPQDEPLPAELLLGARMFLCENHGAETLFKCLIGEQTLVVRMPGTFITPEGSSLRLAGPHNRIHLFDCAGISQGKLRGEPETQLQALAS